MTDWLIARALRGADGRDPAARARMGELAGAVGIICNLALCLAKGAVGIAAGSVAIIADAVNNLSDAASNIVSLAGFKLASKPADPDHPYGHGRFEYLAGLVVAVLVTAIGIELVHASVEKILDPSPVAFSANLAWVLALSIVVKLWMASFMRAAGRRIASETLEATAVDARNDVISTAAVLIAALVADLTGLNLDGWMGVAVGAFILWSGAALVRDAVNPLLGQAPAPELVAHIQQKILSYPGVLGTHDLMVHDYGPGRQFASAHVEMAAEADPLESHELIDTIEQDFKTEDHLIVTLHYDPIVTDDPAVLDMRNWINQAVRTIDPGLSIHDLRCVPGPTQTNVIFDCLRPAGIDLSGEEIKRRVSDLVTAHYPHAVCKITIDESYVSSEQ